MSEHDYSEFQDKAVGDNALARLEGMAQQQRAAEENVVQKQRDLEVAQRQLRDISEKDFPELLGELKMNDFTTSSGLHVSVEESLHTGIPKPKVDEALDWLEKDNSGMIKRTLTVSFNRDQQEEAVKLYAYLTNAGYPVKMERKVEPSTLKAFVKRELEAGSAIPQPLFGVHRRKFTKVEGA